MYAFLVNTAHFNAYFDNFYPFFVCFLQSLSDLSQPPAFSLPFLRLLCGVTHGFQPTGPGAQAGVERRNRYDFRRIDNIVKVDRIQRIGYIYKVYHGVIGERRD